MTAVILHRDDVARILEQTGFRVDNPARYLAAVQDFQRGWHLGTALKVDGIVGTATSAALLATQHRRDAHRPDASPHFSFREFICHCAGRFADCHRIRVHHGLIESLEQWRVLDWPHGLAIIDGYRCPGWNTHVLGASRSQHINGLAVDVPQRIHWSTVVEEKLFSGIGRHQGTGLVQHVDRRDLDGQSHYTTTDPTVFTE